MRHRSTAVSVGVSRLSHLQDRIDRGRTEAAAMNLKQNKEETIANNHSSFSCLRSGSEEGAMHSQRGKKTQEAVGIKRSKCAPTIVRQTTSTARILFRV
jgi:hypothetical protein